MEKLNPIQKLDELLKHIKHVELITPEVLVQYLESRQIDLKDMELERSLKQLIDDGYVYKVNDWYAISVNGYTFIGYENQTKIDRASSKRRNLRDWVLTYGTALAGLAASLLLLWDMRHFFLRIWHVFF